MDDYTKHPDYPKFLEDYTFTYGDNRVDMCEHDFALWQFATAREREACAKAAEGNGVYCDWAANSTWGHARREAARDIRARGAP